MPTRQTGDHSENIWINTKAYNTGVPVWGLHAHRATGLGGFSFICFDVAKDDGYHCGTRAGGGTWQ